MYCVNPGSASVLRLKNNFTNAQVKWKDKKRDLTLVYKIIVQCLRKLQGAKD